MWEKTVIRILAYYTKYLRFCVSRTIAPPGNFTILKPSTT